MISQSFAAALVVVQHGSEAYQREGRLVFGAWVILEQAQVPVELMQVHELVGGTNPHNVISMTSGTMRVYEVFVGIRWSFREGVPASEFKSSNERATHNLYCATLLCPLFSLKFRILRNPRAWVALQGKGYSREQSERYIRSQPGQIS